MSDLRNRKNRDCGICGEHIRKVHKIKVTPQGYRVHLNCAVKKIVLSELEKINNNPELYPEYFEKVLGAKKDFIV